MYDISIIIPHYNTPDLLDKLLKSIPASPDLEIIVVDDKSEQLPFPTDDDRVKLFHNTTDKKGAGVCRNIGLSHAVGKWLLFADADDYFMPDAFEHLKPYLSSDADMVFFVPTSVQLDTGRPSSRHLSYKKLVEDYIENGDAGSQAEMKYTFVTPWSKLIRRDLVTSNDILFDEIAVANDVMFLTKCSYCSRRLLADRNVIYCVTRAAKTLTTKKDVTKFDQREEVFLRRYAYLRERLSARELTRTHLNRIAISHMINAIIYGYGISKAFSLFLSYKRNRVRLLDAGLFNPVTLYKQASMYLSWRNEDKKYQ